MHVVALVKPSEKFIFLYDDCNWSRWKLMQALDSFAADPQLNFTREDAAKLGHQIRTEASEQNG